MSSRKDSTKVTYTAKWLLSWVESPNSSPNCKEIRYVVDYLLHLKSSDLSISSVRSHVASISAEHSQWISYLSLHILLVSRFLKCFINMHPSISILVSSWDPNLVLSHLVDSPFEPLSSPFPLLLSIKTIGTW